MIHQYFARRHMAGRVMAAVLLALIVSASGRPAPLWAGMTAGVVGPERSPDNRGFDLAAIPAASGQPFALAQPAADWQLMASGTLARLWGVWGSSRQDIFAVGSGGVILHYDGASWGPMVSGTTGDLRAVWGSSSTDVFAVGTDFDVYPIVGIILHYDGASWHRMDSGTVSGFAGLWGSSGSDVFVAGDGGAILHYTGAAWSSMDSGTARYLKGLWGSGGSDLFAVGDDATILHYDGAAWAPMAAPRAWCGQGDPVGSAFFLYGLWGSSSHDVFAAGGCATPSGATYSAILHYDGAAWTLASVAGPHVIDTYFTSVWARSDHDVFAADTTGGIVRYDGAGWQSMTSGTDQDLRGIWGSGGEAFAVGGAGVILHHVEAQPPTGCDAIPIPQSPYTDTMPISGTVTLEISRPSDDAYVTLGSTVALHNDTHSIRMGGRPGVAVPYVEYVTGLLFRALQVPQCAQITSAKLRLVTWYQSGVPVQVEVAGQLSPQAETFSAENPWPHQRPKTTHHTPWTLTQMVTGTVESSDLAAVVAEIVGQAEWQPGNDLALVISPVLTGKQTMDWQAYDVKPEGAAQLVIRYEAVVPVPRLYLPLALQT